MLARILSFLTDSVKDEDGRTSSIRLITVLGVGLILLIWAYLSITKSELQKFDGGTAEIILILIGGKVAQAHIENK